MTEHVTEWVDGLPELQCGEEIVRCRDCSKWHSFDVMNGKRYGECDEWKRPDSYCSPATAEDGFCAWGARKEYGEMIHKSVRLMCHECGKETEWGITHRIVDYYGITHCLICEECGKTVPDFAFDGYVKTGKVVIPV